MVIFDATFLLLLFDPKAKTPVDNARERLNGVIKTLETQKTKIGIPTPALSELLIGAGGALQEYMNTITNSKHFKILPFDEKAAIEVALMGREKPKKSKVDKGILTKAKLKFDRQILATAMAEGVKIIYSDDKPLAKLAKRYDINVIGISELAIPPEARQIPLPLETPNPKK